MAIQCYEDENQHGERPQGGTSVTQQRQRDADHGHEADGHPDVDEKVHEYAGGDTVAVDAGKRLPAFLGIRDDPQDQENIEGYHNKAANEAPLLTYRAEDEVCALLRHKTERGLRAAEESFPGQTARSDRDHALVDIVAHTGGILFHAKENLYPFSLMVLEYVIENKFGGEDQGNPGDQTESGHRQESPA